MATDQIKRSEVWFHEESMSHEQAMELGLAAGKAYYAMGDRPRRHVWFTDKDADPLCRVSALFDDREEAGK